MEGFEFEPREYARTGYAKPLVMKSDFTSCTIYCAPQPHTNKPTTMPSIKVEAVYASPLLAPSGSKTFTVTTEPSDGTDTTHLAAVREAVAQLQDRVNVYLTERMEEEKNLGKGVEEGDVEASYGEEGVEEE